MISQTVLGKGLDSGTAFEILSIDIADVDIGKTSERFFKRIRQKQTKTLRRPKPKSAVPWRSPKSRKCALA